jgi:hypothetical protein
MSLEQAACLGQVIAALAVLASLVFVGFQIRQAARFQKLAAVDALSTAIAGINLAGMETPVLGEALATASLDWDVASREQRIVAHYFLMSYFKLAENAWNQRRAGILTSDQWFGWENMLLIFYHSAGVQGAWWPRRRNAFSPPFQAYLSGTNAPRDFATMSEVFSGGGAPRAIADLQGIERTPARSRA